MASSGVSLKWRKIFSGKYKKFVQSGFYSGNTISKKFEVGLKSAPRYNNFFQGIVLRLRLQNGKNFILEKSWG